MNNETRVIIDSDYGFAAALAGTNAPLEIIDRLSLLDVCYFSFDGRKHQGQIIIDQAIETGVEISTNPKIIITSKNHDTSSKSKRYRR